MRRRERSSRSVVPRFGPVLVVFLAVVLQLVGRPPSGLAETPCTYEPRTVSVRLVGEPATLSVGGQGEVLVNGLPCPDVTDVDSPARVATVDTTAAIAVSGTDAADLVRIDQTGPGGAFPSFLSFRLDLGFDAGDALEVVGTSQNDAMSAVATTLHLIAPLEGDVELGGVDAVEVDTGAGDDVVDAGQFDVDAPYFSIPITIRGGDGIDTLTGGVGNDRLYGQGGDDVLDGNDGIDFLNGGPDTDRCWYGDDLLVCDPVIELTPSEGGAGTPVVASGTGWYPENGDVAISFGGAEPQLSLPPGPDGSITSTDLDVPPAAGGSTTVTVTGCQGCPSDPEPVLATTDFTYTGVTGELTLEVTTNPVPAGEPVPVSGSGWYAVEPVSLFVDPAGGELGDAVATPVPNDDGLFSDTFELTVDAAIGEHRLLACQRCDADDERRMETVFSVEAVQEIPTIQVEPDAASAGDTIRVVGFDWDRELGRVHLSIGSPTTEEREIDAFRPDPNGDFDRSYDVPDLPAGSYTVTACQRCGAQARIDATDDVAIEPASSSLLPWILGAVALLLLLAVALWFLLRPKPPATGNEDELRHPPQARVHARARPGAPEVTVSRQQDGTTDHRIRLVPRPDRGTQRVEEMIER